MTDSVLEDENNDTVLNNRVQTMQHTTQHMLKKIDWHLPHAVVSQHCCSYWAKLTKLRPRCACAIHSSTVSQGSLDTHQT